MSEDKDKEKDPELTKIKDFIHDKRFDDVVQIIALYLADSTDENYLDRLENLIETLLTLHGGRTVLRFLIEQLVIDLPSLLENLSKRDSVLRYSFLLLLKPFCENECDLFMPFIEDLINSEDPNIREAALQLVIFMAGGDKGIDDESIINSISTKLTDEKEFIIEKGIQTLKAIGKSYPSLVRRVLTNIVKENAENEELKQAADLVIKAIVTVDQIEEIVEDELTESEIIEKEEDEINDKEIELKKKEIELKKKKLELEEKLMDEKEKSLKFKEEIIDREVEITPDHEDLPKKLKKQIKKDENELFDKEIELKKKGIEIKKKKLEIELKEKEFEEISIQEREKTLKIKEQLLEKESELSHVELELQQKKIEEKEKKLRKTEVEHAEEIFKELEKSQEEKQESNKEEDNNNHKELHE
ncbi:MAG: hypothetical protein KGD73_00725 [Candidatus Lokiarchaeota archaeon]|nr:hypothetical protein [Candidatus Lokiarchaeota archaeon]